MPSADEHPLASAVKYGDHCSRCVLMGRLSRRAPEHRPSYTARWDSLRAKGIVIDGGGLSPPSPQPHEVRSAVTAAAVAAYAIWDGGSAFARAFPTGRLRIKPKGCSSNGPCRRSPETPRAALAALRARLPASACSRPSSARLAAPPPLAGWG